MSFNNYHANNPRVAEISVDIFRHLKLTQIPAQTLTTLKYFYMKYGDQRNFSIRNHINALVSSFCVILIPML